MASDEEMGIASLNPSYALRALHDPRRDLTAQPLQAEQRVGAGFRDLDALVAKCLRKKSKCAALSWNCCGVSTAENTGTSVRNCTSISALITVSATNSWR